MNLFNKIFFHLNKNLNQVISFNWKELALTIKNSKYLNNLDVPNKSVLIIEPNEFHAEILPGYCYYWNQLGYKVYLVVRHKNLLSGVFSRYNENEKPQLICMGHYGLKYFVKKNIIKSFDYTFITSTRLSNKYGFYGLFSDYLGYLPEGRKGYFLVEHNLESLKPYLESQKYDANKIFLLNAYNEDDFTIPMLNPNYFGKVKTPKKDKETVFITIGTVTERNRNFKELLEAIETLKTEKILNFKIYVIGRVDKGVEISKLPKEIIFLGYLSFTEMYIKLEEAHYFLPLLDPEIKGHQRYLKGETTGSWQLCQGFIKPPIIRKEFSETYLFSNKNAILYEKNGLDSALIQACKLSVDKYSSLLEEMEALRDKTRTSSIRNLKNKIN
ncbi:glycosyltransferase [Winogradskyella psychrotolerans]|uniref:glycosyltransferase n=1 Tax=Winogradskyella psychrotolerans TaxID=1344585 RepID=UPI001268210C|nr:glycosyltransferase [Winogradskyella psychrotolerans]